MGGGGVLLAVPSDLNPTPCLILDIIPSESIWVKILSKGHKNYFGCYYPSPDEHYEEIQSLHKQLEQIRSFHLPQSQPSVHAMGDFNFRKIDWETHLTKEGEVLGHSEGLILIDMARDHYVDQLITFPTRQDKTLDQEGGAVSRVNIGSLITASVTSRHTSVIFKMAGKFLFRYVAQFV